MMRANSVNPQFMKSIYVRVNYSERMVFVVAFMPADAVSLCVVNHTVDLTCRARCVLARVLHLFLCIKLEDIHRERTYRQCSNSQTRVI